jgi:hypothetical protein
MQEFVEEDGAGSSCRISISRRWLTARFPSRFAGVPSYNGSGVAQRHDISIGAPRIVEIIEGTIAGA